MKNYLLILFICVSANSQNVYFSSGIDLKNAIMGSKPTNNKPKIDFILQFGMIGGKTEMVIGYEKFNAICFDKFFFGVGHHFNLTDQIKIIPSVEPSLIGRWGQNWKTTSSHLSIGGSLGLRYKLSHHISVELQCNALPRTDLFMRYPEMHKSVPIIYSNYLKILYRL